MGWVDSNLLEKQDSPSPFITINVKCIRSSLETVLLLILDTWSRPNKLEHKE